MSTIPAIDPVADDAFFVGSVADLKWANEEKTMIQCIVTFPNHPLGFTSPMPFTADPRDAEAHGQVIYYRCLQGDFGPIGDYEPPSDALLDGRAQSIIANALLQTQLMVNQHRDELEAGVETTLSAHDFAALQAYRMALRNVSKQPGYPKTIDWPVKPF